MQEVEQKRLGDVPDLRVEVGDVAELTLGQGAGSSEDKRFQYN